MVLGRIVCLYGGCEMKYWLIALLAMVAVCDVAEARGFRFRRGRSVSYSSYASYSASAEEVSTAQGVAIIMARLGRVGHFGGNRGYEGCGSGWTQEAAFNNCCYSWMRTVDVGYAQDSSGRWFCCRRY